MRIVEETTLTTTKQLADLVGALAKAVRGPDGAIRVLETTQLDSDRETKWYVPGVGVVKAKAKGESLVLVASTLLPT